MSFDFRISHAQCLYLLSELRRGKHKLHCSDLCIRLEFCNNPILIILFILILNLPTVKHDRNHAV